MKNQPPSRPGALAIFAVSLPFLICCAGYEAPQNASKPPPLDASVKKSDGGREGDTFGDFLPDPRLGDEGPGVHFERYNYRSGRLSPHRSPEPLHPRRGVSSSKGLPILTVWAETLSVALGEKIAIFASLTGLDGRSVVPKEFVISLVSSEKPSRTWQGPMTPTVLEGEAVWVFEWHADPAAISFSKPGSSQISGPLFLDVVVRARETKPFRSFDQTAKTLISVDSPSAKFVPGKAMVLRSGTDLELALEAQVEREGTYWFWAELWGGFEGTVPVAFGVDRLERVKPGLLSHKLLFGGAIIRDRGVDGPFKVRNIRMSQVDGLPPHESPPIVELEPTAAWSASEFN